MPISETWLKNLLQPDKLTIGIFAIILASLSWVVVIVAPMVPMSGTLDFSALLLFVGVWAVGMVAMMLPSMLPMIYAVEAATKPNPNHRVAEKILQPVNFVFGYFGIWSFVGLLSYFGLIFLFRFDPGFSSIGRLAGVAAGIAVFLAGAYQLSPLKQRALQACRSPIKFIMTKWRSGRFGSLLMGFDYGYFCTKCCWAFMAVLVVVGAMNLLWMVLFAGAIFVEKVAPRGVVVSKGLGVFLMVAGGALALTVPF